MILHLVFIVSSLIDIGAAKKNLIIGGFFFLRDYLHDQSNCLKAAQIAIRDINNYSSILPDYNLILRASNSDCSEPLVVDQLFRLLKPGQENETALALIGIFHKCFLPVSIFYFHYYQGPLCGMECEVTGPLVKLWDSVQVSYGCGSATIEKKQLANVVDPYSNFFRLESSLSDYNQVRLAFLRQYNWTRVFTIYHSGNNGKGFLADQRRMVKFFELNNITIPINEFWLYSGVVTVERLLKEDARVIFIAFSQLYIQEAVVFGCDAYNLGLKGPRYTWINIAYHVPYW